MADKKNQKLYTGLGDKGTTTLYHCDQGRISKSASIIEALGSLDELNAYLGLIKVMAQLEPLTIKINSKKQIQYKDILDEIQQTLFIIQAEIAGSKMTVDKKALIKIEAIISLISEKLPQITSFTISGGSILSAELDFSRTLSRRTERRIVSLLDDQSRKVGVITIAYLNRLSSLLFAMSRYANHIMSIPEEHPKYNK